MAAGAVASRNMRIDFRVADVPRLAQAGRAGGRAAARARAGSLGHGGSGLHRLYRLYPARGDAPRCSRPLSQRRARCRRSSQGIVCLPTHCSGTCCCCCCCVACWCAYVSRRRKCIKPSAIFTAGAPRQDSRSPRGASVPAAELAPAAATGRPPAGSSREPDWIVFLCGRCPPPRP